MKKLVTSKFHETCMWFFFTIHGYVFPYQVNMVRHNYKTINPNLFLFDKMSETVQNNEFKLVGF